MTYKCQVVYSCQTSTHEECILKHIVPAKSLSLIKSPECPNNLVATTHESKEIKTMISSNRKILPHAFLKRKCAGRLDILEKILDAP